jgi:ABC-type multidrug transport system permease subunit
MRGNFPPWWLWMQVVLVVFVVIGMVIAIVQLATS